jgi:hypothetical protein
MAPLIRPGDQVLVSKAVAEQIHFGDIAVFRHNGELVVHRVLKKWQNADGVYFVEKGDAQYTYSLIGGDKVIGRVTMVKGRGKKLSLSSPLGRLTSLVLSAWLYWTGVVITILRSSRSRTVRRAGRVLAKLLTLFSNIMVRICFAVWYPSGLMSSRDGDSSSGR